eukprot:1161643-Pelagomonas_calceolata.AAC.6
MTHAHTKTRTHAHSDVPAVCLHPSSAAAPGHKHGAGDCAASAARAQVSWTTCCHELVHLSAQGGR